MFNKLFIILLLCHFTSFSRQEEFSTLFSVKSKYNSSIEQSSFKDVLNDSIIIIDVDEVYYREGELYWRKDNSSYDGSSKRTGIWASILGKYSGFIGQTYNALKTIESRTKGNELVTSLVNHSSNSLIKKTSRGSYFDPNILTIFWNPHEIYATVNEFGILSKISMIYGLAHELGHNYYRIFNNEIDEIWNYLPSGNPIFTSEIEACKWENLIRKENYQPKRVLYFYCNGFKVGKIID